MMERKHGFFSALKEEVVRGLSPARSRAKSPARSSSPMGSLLRRKKSWPSPDPLIVRSGSLRPAGEALAPLMEGPDPEASRDGEGGRKEGWVGIQHWMKGQLLSRAPSISSSACSKRSDLRLLLGVMGAPLAPVHVSAIDPLPHLSIKDTPIVSATSSPFSLIQQENAGLLLFLAILVAPLFLRVRFPGLFFLWLFPI